MIKRKTTHSKEYPQIYKREGIGFKVGSNMKLIIALVLTFVITLPIANTLYKVIKANNNTENIAGNDDTTTPLSPDVEGIDTCKDKFDANALDRLYWWNDQYLFRKKINFEKKDGFQINKFVSFNFDHKILVTQAKSRADGNDLKIIAKSGTDFRVVQYKVTNPNEVNTEIVFSDPLFKDGTTYFIYYSKTRDVTAPRLVSVEYNSEDSYSLALEDEVDYPIKAKLNRDMVLKSYGEQLKVDVVIDQSLAATIDAVNYEILKTEVSEAIISNNGVYSGDVNISELEAGKYSIQATIYDECFTLKSTIESFDVSYPLFVVWTMDWEGYDATDQFLNQISAISSKYNVPLTQFFNPRLFIAGNIPNARREKLITWIKDRETKNNDEIGLHLHMWNDMVKAAGVTPKNQPNWSNAGNGYDVLFSAYSTDESKRILNWGLREFQNHGFTKPMSFRAGGWEIDEENMAALETVGIKIDSSGRTKHNLGTNLIASKWNLDATTKPYQPSKSDINKTGTDHHNIWEFPNNGADSFIYSYDQLKERFDANYKSMMNTPQVVTILSHPHWFNVDAPKLDQLYMYMDQFSYSDGKGVVVFTTLKDVYNYWTKLDSNDTN